MILPIHFFTLVHNSMPFIKHHLKVFQKLKRPWTWHIAEGITPIPTWFNMPGRITPDMHNKGISTDGTHEYLQEIKSKNVKLHGLSEHYLTDQCQAMLSSICDNCLAWQVDCDEYWTAEQIERMASMFEAQPTRTAAWFLCRFFVGPDLILTGRDCAGNNTSYEWKRVWRWSPSCCYTKHDPPVVEFNGRDISFEHPFWHNDTEKADLVFNHYAYVNKAQVRFKEVRYGFAGATEAWERLQRHNQFPSPIESFLPWLGKGTVDRAPKEHSWTAYSAE